MSTTSAHAYLSNLSMLRVMSSQGHDTHEPIHQYCARADRNATQPEASHTAQQAQQRGPTCIMTKPIPCHLTVHLSMPYRISWQSGESIFLGIGAAQESIPQHFKVLSDRLNIVIHRPTITTSRENVFNHVLAEDAF